MAWEWLGDRGPFSSDGSHTLPLSFQLQCMIHFHQPRLGKLLSMMAWIFPSGNLGAISSNEVLLGAGLLNGECLKGQGEGC